MEKTDIIKTILIIEDEKSLIKPLEEKLKLSHFNTLTAFNGEEGLKAALQHHPDLILLDLMMPKMDGITMLKILREDVWGKTAKVMVLTNIGQDNNTLADVIEENVTEYLVKSNLSLDQILQKVREKLSLK